ncbi:MAG: hypothetical protein ACFFCQ_09785 [Promethearchaeota archaeon]
MSQFITREIRDKVKGSRMAKHIVIKSIIKEHVPDIEEEILNELLMRIHTLFYDSSMVQSLFADIKEREKQKEKLQEMELSDLAALAFGELSDKEIVQPENELKPLIELDETTFDSMIALSEEIDYEEVYNNMKSAGIVIIIDYFSAFHGSTSSVWETVSGFSEMEQKYIIDLFSLFVEKQIEKAEDSDSIGADLASSALSIEVADKNYSIFLYTPKKWLDQGQTHRLTIGLMVHENWSEYISIMSSQIAKRMMAISDLILGSTSEDLSNIQFRLVDLTTRKKLKSQVKEFAEFTIRCSLAWENIKSTSTM